MKDYLIAQHRIRLNGNEIWQEAVAALDGFAAFATETEGEPLAIFEETLSKAPTMTICQYQTTANGVYNQFGLYAEGYIFCMKHENGEQLTLWKPNGKQQVCFNGSQMPQLLKFGLWIAYGLVTLPYDTVAIHTSVIVSQGKAAIFLGESGTGKSTHTRLWRENIADATLLNDDSPIVRIIDDEVKVFGSPWSGKTPCYKQACYPLAGCVRLSQAPYNEIKRLSIPQAYAALHPSCPPDFAYDDTLYDHIGRFIGRILTKVPVFHLACLPNAEAAKLSYKNLINHHS